jgi:hypothetical protein
MSVQDGRHPRVLDILKNRDFLFTTGHRKKKTRTKMDEKQLTDFKKVVSSSAWVIFLIPSAFTLTFDP